MIRLRLKRVVEMNGTWNEAGAVIEVTDPDLARELLRRGDAVPAEPPAWREPEPRPAN